MGFLLFSNFALLWGEEKILVAAAASMEKCFTKDIIPEFRKNHPEIKVECTFDGSGKLRMQIEQGMEAHIFLSASPDHVERISNFAAKKVNLLKNKLVLVVNPREKTKITDFYQVINAKIIAMGDPEIVPAGSYAKKVLETMGLWEKLNSQVSVSFAGNVTEALNAVVMGVAQCGFVYSTDAKLYEKTLQVTAVAPEDVASPVYPLVLLKNGENSPGAKKLFDFLQSPQCLEIFRSYGFETDTE